MITPQSLKPGDLVGIVAPAKAIEEAHLVFAQKFFQNAGFKVVLGAYAGGSHNYFSGTVPERLSDFQTMLDNPDVKAIICARGGYGCVQLVDRIQWANAVLHPKWLVGFSDVTVFHQRSNRLDVKSIHATMPLNFKENSQEALDTLVKALTGKSYTIEAPSNPNNSLGSVSGKLIGGNLSIVYSLLGTDDSYDFDNAILFLEDLSEQLYAVDRMFYALQKSGALDKIKGLVIGGMTNMKDTATPFGATLEAIVRSHFEYKSIPICFDFPAGHINDNRALVLGSTVALDIQQSGTKLRFIE